MALSQIVSKLVLVLLECMQNLKLCVRKKKGGKLCFHCSFIWGPAGPRPHLPPSPLQPPEQQAAVLKEVEREPKVLINHMHLVAMSIALMQCFDF